MIYKSRGETDKAEEHYIASIGTLENYYGKVSEQVAAVYNNLGALYYQAGYQEQAREMHLTALDVRTELFGEDHPDVAQSHSNLALCYYELEDYPNCHQAFENALRILELHVKDDVEEYSVVAENYADLLRVAGLERKAANLEKKVAKAIKKHAHH